MAANITDEILKHFSKNFPDLEEGWKEMEEKLKAEPAEREMLSLKYREMLQRESLKESLVESEFTKAKRAESDSKVMKANEMPKRIYLFDYNDAMVTPLEGDTVYVREDVFMEKACDYINRHLALLDAENNNCMPEWLENFKKAMKL